MTRVLVCGGRDFDDPWLFNRAMDRIMGSYEDVELVSGGARGADAMAEAYAADRSIPMRIFPARWDRHGRKAGMIRNGQMLSYACEAATAVVVAFWDGRSKGTANMIDRAKRSGRVELCIFRYGGLSHDTRSLR